MKLLVIDGNSLVNRAYYGIRPLTNKDGQYTHAIYGFLNMLHKIEREEAPGAVAVAFDLKAPTFRHKAYDGYKATRKGMPPELASQMPVLKELLSLLGYRLVTCEGFEADDILGTFARACEHNSDVCVIATGDRDSLQLVSDETVVRLCTNKGDIRYTPEAIMEEYGVTPPELVEIKAIQGDTSDNIPGVAGIGPKGAGELIRRFHSVAAIYDSIDTLDIKDGVRKKLLASKDNALLSRTLGEIRRDAPIDTDASRYTVVCAEPAKALALMQKLELFSLIEKYGLGDAAPVAAEPKDTPVMTVLTDKFPLEKYHNGETIYLYAEFSDKELKSFAVFDADAIYCSEDAALFRSLLTAPGLRVYTRGSKAVFAYADRHGFEAESIAFDVELAAYLLRPSDKDYTDETLCAVYGITLPAAGEHDDFRPLAVYDRLCEKLENEIRANEQERLLFEIELPLARVLARMENLGVAVDRQGIADYGEVLSAQIGELEAAIYQAAGQEFNINSPKQLGKVLFEDLGLPAKKKTKSGYSTNAEVLEGLRYQHPVVDMVLTYRALTKLNSTYCEGLLKVIADDGRIHSSFNQTETRTGRISSAEPNLQNIPVRTELGREMRKFFRAREGWVLVDADYSQIELRVLAHIANDANMIAAFRNGDDIHAITASQVFHMPLEMVTPAMRRNAKAVNFGIVYGIGAFSLGKDIGVSTREAKQYIESYLAHYSGVAAYMERVVEQARRDGYVETLFGRRRYLPELSSGKQQLKAFGERVAMNMPIQGTAADIIKIAMIRVDERLRRESLRARLVLQVHDELIVEAPAEEGGRVKALLQEEMENAVSLSVPLTADAAIGRTWYDAKG